MREEAQEWFSKAEEDFQTAVFNFKGSKLSAAAFFSQQAAEKALKAVQIERHGRFDRVHDLVALGGSVNAPNNIIKDCEKLTPFYVITRYPNSKDAYDKKEVLSALNSSKEVMKWVNHQLK